MNLYEKINLEKGMYSISGKSFSEVLEELDPSTEYIGTSLEGLDAFQRQLKRFDIKVGGRDSDRVDKFFSTASSAALFPEYVCRAVKQGMEVDNLITDIVAAVTTVDGLDYRSITSSPLENEKETKAVAEGASIPSTNISVKDNLIKLKKRGRMLVGSYEALRFQRLDLFTVALKQIGSYISKTLLDDACKVLINGDGNNNPISSIQLSSSGNITYPDLINLWKSLSPYKLNTIIAPTEAIAKILNTSEMKDSKAGLTFHSTGNMVTPLGAKIICCDSLPENTIIGLDKNYALEMIQAGDVVTEYDKLIDRQLERAAISYIAGFAKIFNDASVKLG